MKINKTKLLATIAPIITLVAGYLGFEPIQQLKTPSTDVEISVNVPEKHQSPPQKDWNPIIDKKVDALRKEMMEYH